MTSNQLDAILDNPLAIRPTCDELAAAAGLMIIKDKLLSPPESTVEPRGEAVLSFPTKGT